MNLRSGTVRVVVFAMAALILPLSAGAQTLSVSPTSINVQASAGSAIPSQSISISNVGNRALKWSVAPLTASWLRVSPTSGVGGQSDTVTVSFPSPLPGGVYQTSLRIESDGGSAVTVSVQLTILGGTSAPPTGGGTPTLTGLSISGPATTTVGQTLLYTATATYSDGKSWNVTNNTGWWTSNASVATITAAGVLSALTAGPVTVQASYGGLSAPPLPVSVASTGGGGGTITLTGLSISGPATATVGQTPQYTANATYSDGSSWNVTNNTGWWTSNTSVATISLAGVLSAVAAGTVSVQASYGGISATPLTVTVGSSGSVAPAGTSASGPQPTIYCPAGSIDIWPGTSIQTMVDLYAGGTTFCLRAGVHYLSSAITPKTGNTFVGQYGAILDGSRWSTSDATQAAFRAHNQDIDYVTIRNLVIRSMPQRGIHAYYYLSDHWTIEYNEIASNTNAGIVFPSYTVVRNNYIHHNPYSGYMGVYSHNSTLDGNEIAYNGREQKIGESANVTVRNNFVHHNVGNGIWYDGSNIGAVIEGNRVEDNGGSGIHYEISSDVIIRNNAIRRSGEVGVFISTSKNAQVFNNTLENNFRGILYFVSCYAISIGFDLSNNTVHDNTITVGTQSGALASGLSYTSDCTSTLLAPFLSGAKNVTFSRNTYHVPSPSTVQYWLWNTFKYWYQWQALPQDATSTVSQ